MTRPATDSARLLDAAARIEKELATVPPITGPDYIASRAQHVRSVAEALDRLRADWPDLRVREDFNGVKVRMLGLGSSSTSGTANALRNWITRARATATRIGEDADHA